MRDDADNTNDMRIVLIIFLILIIQMVLMMKCRRGEEREANDLPHLVSFATLAWGHIGHAQLKASWYPHNPTPDVRV